MAAMHLASLPLRPWHFGRQVVPGPDYEDDDQLEAADLEGAWLQEPDDLALRAWAAICCEAPPDNMGNPLGGWSPGRSIVANLLREDGTLESFYYKLYDGPDLRDVDGHPSDNQFDASPARWRVVWERFLSACLHFEVLLHHTGLVMEVARREVDFWHDAICVELAAAMNHPAGSAQQARDGLVIHSYQWYMATLARRANLLDARIFLHQPELVFTHIVQRSRRAA